MSGEGKLARRLTPCVCGVVLALALLAEAPAAENGPRFSPPKKYYLALGDSHAYGFQESKLGLPPSAFDTGYVDVFAARLRSIRPDIEVVNYGCPGETTASFIAGPCFFTSIGGTLHDAFTGSQLSAAVAFIRANPGRVSPITLNLWGNDLSAFIRTCGFPAATDFACIQAGAPVAISQFASRLSQILAELRDAAPEAEIIITGAYNVFVGAFPLTDPLFFSLTHAMAVVAAQEGAFFADEFPVFNPQGSIAAETAAICTLTLLCTQGDGHPSDAGYQAIASIVWDASGYSRLLE